MRPATLAVVTLTVMGLTGAWAQGAGSQTASKTKPVVAKRVAKVAPVAAVAVQAAPVVAVAPLGEAEMAVAPHVYVGELPCELGQKVHLQADPAHPGYFHLQVKQQRFHLRPVPTSTGAVRLEDPAQGAVWLQLANKSMLMNQKLGRRMADECMSPVQQAMTEHLKHNPAPHLLDVAQTPR